MYVTRIKMAVDRPLEIDAVFYFVELARCFVRIHRWPPTFILTDVSSFRSVRPTQLFGGS